jgi:outer membrane protein OmpA-like peptidoglycan-associated protein
MVKVIAAALLVCSFSLTRPALSQTAANPTQRPAPASEGQVPIFQVTVVGHTTPAINYRPRKGETRVDFEGTALLPRARGKATISGEKGYITVDASFDRLDSATKFGREYLTYVLWAVTPEGRATNLGEMQVDGDDAQVRVTTELQAFALIVTAEPYFAVTQPSDVVVMENVLRKGTNGKIETIQARYDLLKRGTYLMNQDVARLKVKPLEPGAPLDLAEARNAVALARLAGADQYAADTFTRANGLLADAERARDRRKRGNEVQMPARQAVQTAEDARLIALQRADQERIALERTQAEQREREARDRQAAADRLRSDAEAARLAAEREKASALSARAEADAARRDAEAQAQRARSLAEQSQHERDEFRNSLRTQLDTILETRETARGLIVNLSDVLFDFNSASLKPGAREKLARVSGILAAHRGLHVAVEGHTDGVGSDSYNQRLSEQRAISVSDFLVQQGIGEAVATAGFGKSRPVASNDTAEGRQKNRRVELVVTGESIARR